ncbi:hypothetical protein BC937DRAFT_88056 [Endogone sp. FLAS-F59071]|nr:hypothetical protein BC937DRAFT_88056 [Endogone sp. FLAS-F59071]|eukprot:RUS19035.1 hypothetical protein BC937DRAFT_88056 [Endogone sp. FLAS-F59071]
MTPTEQNNHSRSQSSTSVRKIPAYFGDIMSSRQTSLTFPGGFSGMERIVLTANGNLQRIFSAFFNLPVTVDILKNEPLPPNARFDDESDSETDTITPVLQRYDREVNLCCGKVVVCNARSRILIRDANVLDMVVNRGVGIGQLFRYFDKLPKFILHAVGRRRHSWWREYSLRMSGVECRIRETFLVDMFEEGWFERAEASGDGNVSLLVESDTDGDTTWVFESDC